MDGLIRWPNYEESALIAFIVRDGNTWDTLYGPTMSEIEKKCEECGLDPEPIKEQMRKHPECHTFFLDTEKYHAASS